MSQGLITLAVMVGTTGSKRDSAESTRLFSPGYSTFQKGERTGFQSLFPRLLVWFALVINKFQIEGIEKNQQTTVF